MWLPEGGEAGGIHGAYVNRRQGVSLALVVLLTLVHAARFSEHGTLGMSLRAIPPRCTVVRRTELVSQLTGRGSPARTDERWNVTGTDLGFTFEHASLTYMVFGDTWGRTGPEGADWRSNTLAIVEPDPEHGYIVADMVSAAHGEARELLPSLKQPKTEYTVIPTSGIADGDRLYLHYMSIRDWEAQPWGYKHPAVNGAGLAYSDDRGQTWVKDERARWPGDSPFTQAALVADGEHIYMFGTPAGRFGPARLLRTPSGWLLEPERYEYWTGGGWSARPDEAVIVVPDPVGELSVRWSPYHGRWLMMYLNDVEHAIVLRTAAHPTGPWDEERVLVSAVEYPTLYAPYMLPHIDGPEVYFTMSIYENAYQVFLMKLTLDRC
jgi:hypothetical protein